MRRIGIIGFGAIGRSLAAGLAAVPDVEIGGILVRERSAERIRDAVPDGIRIVTDIRDLLELAPHLIVECAGHEALQCFGAPILAVGTDLLVASVGALADPDLESELREATLFGGRLLIPSGARGGLDALGAARAAGLDSVAYVGRKAPSAWRGTRAETLIDLDAMTAPQVFFESDARQAALEFPKNANVVAAVALAGVGFEATRVQLVVDPAAVGNQHEIQARGAFGDIFTRVVAKTLPDNPRTSMLAPYSLVHSVRKTVDSIVIW